MKLPMEPRAAEQRCLGVGILWSKSCRSVEKNLVPPLQHTDHITSHVQQTAPCYE